MKLDGIISGMDTESIVNALMQQESKPLERLHEEQDDISAERKAWNKINARLSAIDSAAETLDDVDLTDVYSASSSNSDVLTAEAAGNAEVGEYTLEVDQLAARASAWTLVDVADGETVSGDITINLAGSEKTISVTDATKSELVDAINADYETDKEAGDPYLRATVIGDRIHLERANTGYTGTFTVNSTLQDSESNAINFDTFAGRDAQLSADFDGDGTPEITHTSSSNAVDGFIDGLTLHLHESGTGPVTVNVKRDVQGITSEIKDFVSAVNDLQSYVSERTGEEAAMQGDYTVYSLTNRIRSHLAATVEENDFIQDKFDVGMEFSRSGELMLDEAALSAAMESNPDEVGGFFSSVAQSMRESFLNPYLESGGILADRDNSFEQRLSRIDESISDMQYRLELKEQQLYAKFAQMESIIKKMQSQGEWLSQVTSAMDAPVLGE